jgi:hypothetical protein
VVEYVVTVIPTGETFTVAGEITQLLYTPADPLQEMAFTVTATFADGDGPPSSASVLAAAAPPEEPITTTTSAAGPSSGPIEDRADGANTTPREPSRSTLPATGVDVGVLVLVALALLAVGRALTSARRRSSAHATRR